MKKIIVIWLIVFLIISPLIEAKAFLSAVPVSDPDVASQLVGIDSKLDFMNKLLTGLLNDLNKLNLNIGHIFQLDTQEQFRKEIEDKIKKAVLIEQFYTEAKDLVERKEPEFYDENKIREKLDEAAMAAIIESFEELMSGIVCLNPKIRTFLMIETRNKINQIIMSSISFNHDDYLIDDLIVKRFEAIPDCAITAGTTGTETLSFKIFSPLKLTSLLAQTRSSATKTADKLSSIEIVTGWNKMLKEIQIESWLSSVERYLRSRVDEKVRQREIQITEKKPLVEECIKPALVTDSGKYICPEYRTKVSLVPIIDFVRDVRVILGLKEAQKDIRPGETSKRGLSPVVSPEDISVRDLQIPTVVINKLKEEICGFTREIPYASVDKIVNEFKAYVQSVSGGIKDLAEKNRLFQELNKLEKQGREMREKIEKERRKAGDGMETVASTFNARCVSSITQVAINSTIKGQAEIIAANIELIRGLQETREEIEKHINTLKSRFSSCYIGEVVLRELDNMRNILENDLKNELRFIDDYYNKLNTIINDYMVKLREKLEDLRVKLMGFIAKAVQVLPKFQQEAFKNLLNTLVDELFKSIVEYVTDVLRGIIGRVSDRLRNFAQRVAEKVLRTFVEFKVNILKNEAMKLIFGSYDFEKAFEETMSTIDKIQMEYFDYLNSLNPQDLAKLSPAQLREIEIKLINYKNKIEEYERLLERKLLEGACKKRTVSSQRQSFQAKRKVVVSYNNETNQSKINFFLAKINNLFQSKVVEINFRK